MISICAKLCANKTAVIFAARPVAPCMRSYVPKAAYIITADAGWQAALRLGYTIDLAVGDFDTAPPPQNAKQLLALPREKDDTDTHFAVRQAILQGCGRVVLLGAMGGRADHSFANIQSLLYLARAGALALMANEDSEIYVLGKGPHRIKAQKGRCISVFALAGAASGVQLSGVRYPLQNASLSSHVPIGTSNEFTQEYARVSCKKGWLLVMVCNNTG